MDLLTNQLVNGILNLSHFVPTVMVGVETYLFERVEAV
jgi:hypothetical protein